MLKRVIAFGLMLMILLGCAAFAEEEIEFTLEDIVELEEVPVYGEVDWNFPVDLKDMDPVMIRLANKHCLLSKEDKPDPIMSMVSRKASKMQLQETCGLALVEMFEGALKDGIKLYLKSAYRSYQTQNTMYYNRLKKNHGKDDGWVSKPGASDHQTGLGCDIVSRSWRDKAMNRDFGKTDEAKWMAENAYRYGFILRYPSDKEEITEINFEPWHYRYVGIPVATYIKENGLCLEEFHEQLQAAIDEFIAAGGDPAIVDPYIQRSAE